MLLPAVHRAAVAVGEFLQSPHDSGLCLTHGDAWLRSFLVLPPDTAAAATPARPATWRIALIDWEFAHWGCPTFDVAHLAAHLWSVAANAGAPRAATAVLHAFLSTYHLPAVLLPHAAASHALCVLRHHAAAEIIARLGAYRAASPWATAPPPVLAAAADVAVLLLVTSPVVAGVALPAAADLLHPLLAVLPLRPPPAVAAALHDVLAEGSYVALNLGGPGTPRILLPAPWLRSPSDDTPPLLLRAAGRVHVDTGDHSAGAPHASLSLVAAGLPATTVTDKRVMERSIE